MLFRVLAFLILGFLQTGGEAWVGMLHVLSCRCCEQDARSGSCCSKDPKDAKESAGRSERGCSCALAPAEPSNVPASAPVQHPFAPSVQLSSSPEILLRWTNPATPAVPSARTLGPPGSRADRLLHGSGGERSAFLGSARR